MRVRAWLAKRIKQHLKCHGDSTRPYLVACITCAARKTTHAVWPSNAIAHRSDRFSRFGTGGASDTRRRNRIVAAKHTACALSHRLGRLAAHDTILPDDTRIDSKHSFLDFSPIAYDAANEALRRAGDGRDRRGDHTARTRLGASKRDAEVARTQKYVGRETTVFRIDTIN